MLSADADDRAALDGPWPAAVEESAPRALAPRDRLGGLLLGEAVARGSGAPGSFIDVDSIPLATNFEDRIQAALDSCRVVFVLIGSQWLTARLPSGERRLDDEDDYVRQEVAAALAREEVVVVPDVNARLG